MTDTPQTGTEDTISLDGATWRQVLLVMERLASSSDLPEVLRLVIDAMRECLGADRASVLQYDHGTDELFASEAHGVDGSLRFCADAGLAGEALRRRSIVNVPDCYADSRFNRRIDQRTGYHTRCLLSVPLESHDGRIEGVVQVLNKGGGEGDGRFDGRDETIARALAAQAAVAIRRATLIEAERRKEKMEADLRVAREIQIATQPTILPSVDGYHIDALSRTADETGGDAYDVFKASDGARLIVLMADATGHGIGPALSVTRAQAMLRLGAGLGLELDELVTHLNKHLNESLPVGRFVTAFIAALDVETHTLRYIAAGQAPIVILRAGAAPEILGSNAMPLGIDPRIVIANLPAIRLNKGDALLLLSDGIYERPNSRDEHFGTQRILDIAAEHLAGSPKKLLTAIMQAADTFASGRAAPDDQTAVIIKRD